MILTHEYINHLFLRFKQAAKKSLERGCYDRCLSYLKAASHTAYTFYLGFTDSEIEGMLQMLSEHLHKRNSNNLGFRCVFYDTFSQDAQGLTMQYVDAIIAAGWEVLYITEFGLDDPRSVRLKKTLQDYSNATIVTVPKKNRMEKAQFVYDAILDYAPDKLFMHIHPSAVEAVTAFYALPRKITKYQINLTDHTYWVGAGCVDYSLEFREYGASLSVGKRGIPTDRVMLMPYYPMMKAAPFEGFPKESDGKVKIFAGASYYKIIDQDETFFKLNRAILDANPEAVTLFAGGGDMKMLQGLIAKHGLAGRFIPIGQRNDVFECYKHSDIYLSTFPHFGALMAQYAAHTGLPILAYAKAKSGIVEEVVCQKHQERITFMSIEDLVEEASRLVNDEEYRIRRGLAIQRCVVSVDEFNESFKQSVLMGVSQYPLMIDEDIPLHYQSVEDKLKLENRTKNYSKSIFSTLGIIGLFVSPRIWMDGVWARIKTSRLYKLCN